MKILLVEDDRALAEAMRLALEAAGEQVSWMASGEAAMAALAHAQYDLMVLDIGLPGMDGFAVLRVVRARYRQLPVLMLTARDALDDRVRGLDLGADDYLIKPVEIRELVARARAILRRTRQEDEHEWVHGALRVDFTARRIWLADSELLMSAREWALLVYLLRRRGRIVAKDQIAQALAGMDDELSANAVEMYIHRLRGKLANSGVEIRTVRGLGYLLEKSSGENA